MARHYLIVLEYNFCRLIKHLNDAVGACVGKSWAECGLKLSRIGRWEFEDYDE